MQRALLVLAVLATVLAAAPPAAGGEPPTFEGKSAAVWAVVILGNADPDGWPGVVEDCPAAWKLREGRERALPAPPAAATVALGRLLDDPEPYVRLEAAVALVKAGGDRGASVGVVVDALSGPDEIDREFAARALLRLGAGPVEDWLLALLSRGPGRLTSALGAIADAPGDERAFLLEELARIAAGGDARLAAAARIALDLLDLRR